MNDDNLKILLAKLAAKITPTKLEK